jgi:hypothetical protein
MGQRGVSGSCTWPLPARGSSGFGEEVNYFSKVIRGLSLGLIACVCWSFSVSFRSPPKEKRLSNVKEVDEEVSYML